MTKCLILAIAIITLALFTTRAVATHIEYAAGSTYTDPGIIACQTENASLKVIHHISMVNIKANNCVFYREPVTFFINSLICKVIIYDMPFTLTKIMLTLNGKAQEKFAILLTSSNEIPCDLSLI